MLAIAVIAALGILNVSIWRFCPESCLSGHDNIADVRSVRRHAAKFLDPLGERWSDYIYGPVVMVEEVYGQLAIILSFRKAKQIASAVSCEGDKLLGQS